MASSPWATPIPKASMSNDRSNASPTSRSMASSIASRAKSNAKDRACQATMRAPRAERRRSSSARARSNAEGPSAVTSARAPRQRKQTTIRSISVADSDLLLQGRQLVINGTPALLVLSRSPMLQSAKLRFHLVRSHPTWTTSAAQRLVYLTLRPECCLHPLDLILHATKFVECFAAWHGHRCVCARACSLRLLGSGDQGSTLGLQLFHLGLHALELLLQLQRLTPLLAPQRLSAVSFRRD